MCIFIACPFVFSISLRPNRTDVVDWALTETVIYFLAPRSMYPNLFIFLLSYYSSLCRAVVVVLYLLSMRLGPLSFLAGRVL